MRSRWVLVLAAATWLFAGCAGVPSGPAEPVSAEWERCVWVDRWDYRTAEDVRRVVQDCAALGFRTVFFQVRNKSLSSVS